MVDWTATSYTKMPLAVQQRRVVAAQRLHHVTVIVVVPVTVLVVKVKVKERIIAVNGTPSDSYGVSLAIWDHTVLPATRHK